MNSEMVVQVMKIAHADGCAGHKDRAGHEEQESQRD